MARDISAVGAKIVFSGGSIGSLTISEFSDEGTPFECSDIDVSTNAKNLNGEMISSRTPSIYSFSVTVIPGSVADLTLRTALAKSSLQPGNNNATEADYIDTVTVSLPKVYASGTSGQWAGDGTKIAGSNAVTFTKVRIKGGPTGPSTGADGRMSARTYNFEAEGFEIGAW